jgi:hypothetical protein
MSAPTLDRTLSLPQLARAWGWPEDKLRRLVKARRIPHLRESKRIYFELSAVERWKDARRVRERQAVTEDIPARGRDERAALADLIDPALDYPWE